jgi:calcium-dependent protein kinase
LDAKDLIQNMLCEPSVRFTAEQVLNHIWVANLAPNSEDCLLELNLDVLKNNTHSNKFKKAALIFIASRLKEDQIKTLKEIFLTLDINNDGFLTFQEFKKGCEKLDKNIDFEDLFSSLDNDKNGKIHYTEFLAGTIDKHIYLKNERLFEAFKKFDKDGSGKISKNEVIQVINAQFDDIASIEDVMKKFDLDGDGELDYFEFGNMMANY